jgi:hypothetical protein
MRKSNVIRRSVAKSIFLETVLTLQGTSNDI